MDKYITVVLMMGIASFGMAFIPKLASRINISYALIYVILGALLYSLFPQFLPNPDPHQQPALVTHFTELIVIVSLMGAGIKLDRPFSFRTWKIPLRLVSITMLLCIGAITLLGISLLQFSLPSALLLAAALAPTDPVLAADVQVGPPHEKLRSESRFSLTAEAGLNDGMAFPFVWLAILLAIQQAGKEVNILEWFSYHLLYKIAVGTLIGWLCGKLTGFMVFKVSERWRLLKPTDGFIAISLTLFCYGFTEVAHGYGFVAVFIAAISFRHFEKGNKYHRELHSFTDQIERLLLSMLLLFFGGAITQGLLKDINWQIVVFACLFILMIRPLAAYLSLCWTPTQRKERLAISFLGIRGVGSIYYISFAMEEHFFAKQDYIWTTLAFTLMLSVAVHGLTAAPIMEQLNRHIGKKPIPE